ncbi:hypothetical protein GCM10008995_08190 [Halobellus salinus]|uniref:Uncharacterized protein n=1 Tax=Halobellus salinus TaxID=931585 RepID=A0A830EE00_9EURY|nr:DUF5790 family protein [Halobellus salinus]GGJ00733.1 hypothetical protein GCM10008995_08190 [Halobellus salinus]SMP01253.1 hypothetical protein SAMN06265347_10188 [Halobellus salinus]
MSDQTTLADDDLFGEAAAEMREEVAGHLDDARAVLPDPDAVWDVEADNVLGVLNTLRSALDVGDAAEHLRQAKKTFIVGQRADAFDDPDDLEAKIEDLESLVTAIEDAEDTVGDLTGTVPGIRNQLREAVEGDGAAADAADDTSDAEA